MAEFFETVAKSVAEGLSNAGLFGENRENVTADEVRLLRDVHPDEEPLVGAASAALAWRVQAHHTIGLSSTAGTTDVPVIVEGVTMRTSQDKWRTFVDWSAVLTQMGRPPSFRHVAFGDSLPDPYVEDLELR